jgi:hypothetical protein
MFSYIGKNKDIHSFIETEQYVLLSSIQNFRGILINATKNYIDHENLFTDDQFIAIL